MSDFTGLKEGDRLVYVDDSTGYYTTWETGTVFTVTEIYSFEDLPDTVRGVDDNGVYQNMRLSLCHKFGKQTRLRKETGKPTFSQFIRKVEGTE